MSNLNDIKKELRSFSAYLDNWGKNVKNANILNTLSVLNSGEQIQYSLERAKPLIFQNIDIERHVIPKGIDKLCPKNERDFKVELTINLAQLIKPEDAEDPILNLGVSIKVEGDYIDKDDYESVICCWHLDKGNIDESLYNHPIYHMNFGGDLMSDKLTEEKNPKYFGGLLLLPSPRVMHPPMDIILACDFIIKNFYEKSKHIEMTTLPGYVDLINKSKNRYVKPYAYALASAWEKSLEKGNLKHSSLFIH